MMMLGLGAVILSISAPAHADDAADIRALEERWGASFLNGDRAFLEGILAPEFKLMRAADEKVLFTPRASWLATLGNYKFHSFDVRVADVSVVGDTAVATIQGGWKISYTGRGTREEKFILSDTWVKRDGRWQVVYRHSTPFGTVSTPEPAAK